MFKPAIKRLFLHSRAVKKKGLKHNVDITFYFVVTYLLAKRNMIIHLECCWFPPDQCKSKYPLAFSSALVFTNRKDITEAVAAKRAIMFTSLWRHLVLRGVRLQT